MRYATFINWTEEEFIGYWNGRPYTFKPGQKKEHLNEAIGRHFAKHLTNQYLQLHVENGEKYTSPKKPLEVPKFMQYFDKAFHIEGDGSEVDAETGLPADGQVKPSEAGLPDMPNEPSMNIQVKPREDVDPYDASAQKDLTGPGNKSTVVATIETDEAPQADEKTEEDDFEGNKPEENK